jgi:purine-nucleoside phosphorylase
MIDSEHYRRQIDEAIAFLRKKTSVSPRLGIILGTGMSEMLPDMAVDSVIAYADIPSFPKPTVEGHTGNLVFGVVGQTNVAVLQGRFHYYEGYTARELTLPVRVLAGLGIEVIIIVNAAGGLNTGYSSGTVMILNDHLNFIGDNPLRGPNVDAWGPRFPDLSNTYDAELIDLTIRCGRELQIGNLTTGVYIAIPGPSLETPAETRFLRSCGGDAVGMSTVPEVIVARHAGMKILGLSLIANVNDPDDFQPVVLEEVIGRVKEEMPRLMRLITGVIRKMEAIGL